MAKDGQQHAFGDLSEIVKLYWIQMALVMVIKFKLKPDASLVEYHIGAQIYRSQTSFFCIQQVHRVCIVVGGFVHCNKNDLNHIHER